MPVPEPEPEPSEALLEVLLCPECDAELSAPQACGPLHALLQDSPLQHPLLLPLMEKVVREIREAETKICPTCRIPIATQECPHIVDKFGQIWMSKAEWHKHLHRHGEVVEELTALERLHDRYVENQRIEMERLVEERHRWGAVWAQEKFARACLGKVVAKEFQDEFVRMLDEDT